MSLRRRLTILAVAGALLAMLARWSFSAAPSSHECVRGQNETVLFLSLAESGQINVQLATCQALLERHPNIKIHIASFSGMADKVAQVSSYGLQKSPSAHAITFHEIPGTGRITSMMRQLGCKGDSVVDCLMHAPGARGIDHLASQLEFAIWAWPGQEHEAIYEHIKGLIQQIDPAVVIVDQAFRPALDATHALNWNQIIITPLALADLFSTIQPYLSVFWKYPSSVKPVKPLQSLCHHTNTSKSWGTGFSFPVPWSKIPENIYITARLVYTLLARPYSRDARNYLKERGIDSGMAFDPYSDITYISQTLPGASIPLEVIPKKVVPAGVILLESGAADEQFAELLSWLNQAPTIVINLGSLFKYSEDRAMMMAEAIHAILRAFDVQILWKMAGAPEISGDYLLSSMEDVGTNRIRIMEWLPIDTLTLLAIESVVLSVHHGGSSSYVCLPFTSSLLCRSFLDHGLKIICEAWH